MGIEGSRSLVPGGAEDEVITEQNTDRTQVETEEVPEQPTPERHEPGGPYDEDSAEATFFQARYDVEETNKKGEEESGS
jgi:hypothetical protein